MVKKGEIYRHFKGNKYGVITVAQDCDSEDEYVVYKDLETSKVYLREINNFESDVLGGVKRFTLIDTVEIDN